MLENPQALRKMVERSGAKSTNLLCAESANALCAKCDAYAKKAGRQGQRKSGRKRNASSRSHSIIAIRLKEKQAINLKIIKFLKAFCSIMTNEKDYPDKEIVFSFLYSYECRNEL